MHQVHQVLLGLLTTWETRVPPSERPGALDVPSDQIQGPLHTRASVSPGSRCCCPFSTLLALLLTMTLPYVESACPTRFFTHEDR